MPRQYLNKVFTRLGLEDNPVVPKLEKNFVFLSVREQLTLRSKEKVEEIRECISEIKMKIDHLMLMASRELSDVEREESLRLVINMGIASERIADIHGFLLTLADMARKKNLDNKGFNHGVDVVHAKVTKIYNEALARYHQSN